MNFVEKVKKMSLSELKSVYNEMLTHVMTMNPNDQDFQQAQLDIYEVMKQIEELEQN
ncbi:MAG: hypothetical protein ACQEXX_01690 [Bacillota bacterium]